VISPVLVSLICISLFFPLSKIVDTSPTYYHNIPPILVSYLLTQSNVMSSMTHENRMDVSLNLNTLYE
jgi:hypothetical protein